MLRTDQLVRRAAFLVLAALIALLPLGGCSVLKAAPIGPVTLRFAYRPGQVEMQPLLDAYMRDNPGIVVEAVELSDSTRPSLNRDLQEGKIDIVRDYRGSLYFQVRAGTFEPLDGMVEGGDWGKFRDDYFAGAWDGLKVDGVLYGVPAGLEMYVAYANLDAFESAFVEPPPVDWTLDDLVLYASQENQPEGTPGQAAGVVYGFGTYYLSVDPVILVYLRGGDLLDSYENPTTAYLNTTEALEAVTFYTDLVTRYHLSPRPALVGAYFRSGGMPYACAQGYCALWFGMFSQRGGGTNVYGTIDNWDFNWKMLPLPRGAQTISLGDVDGYYIASNSDNKQQALKLVRYLADQWEASGVRFPVRKSHAADVRYINKVGRQTAEIGSLAAENLVILPQLYGRPGGFILGSFFNAIFRIIESHEDPQAALDSAQEEITARLLGWQSEEED